MLFFLDGYEEGGSDYKLLNCIQAMSRKKCRKESGKPGKNDFDEVQVMHRVPAFRP